jgi:pimeloyl-ACP methyl ester carboxylesterase
LLHLVGDMVGLLDALGVEQAVIAGHDWGAPVAWHAALLRPDRFRAVIGLSVPYRPRAMLTHLRHAAARGCSVLPALFSDTGSRRGRVRTRRTANLPQDIR